MKVLIFGMGNLLRSDDGVGLHIIEALFRKRIEDYLVEIKMIDEK